MFVWPIDESIRLVLPQHNMAEELTALIHKNLDRLMPWMNWATDECSVEDTKAWIDVTLKTFVENGSFAACILSDDKTIGTISYHGLDLVNRSCYVGYWIDKEFEGKGIITKCCTSLIDHIFEDRELNRVVITCNVQNIRSRAVPERLGFKFEGIRRQAEFLHDHFGDWAVYAMLKDEWKTQG